MNLTLTPLNSTEPAISSAKHRLTENLLTQAELAEALGKSPRTIQRWRKARRAPPAIVIGNSTFFKIQSVQAWLDDHESGQDKPKKRR